MLEKLGFVKLARYGLVLTPEGRIMSMRPTILDDGLGGKVVGWKDNDLAAAELQKWEPARPGPAPVRAVPPRMVIPPKPPVPKAVVTEHTSAIPMIAPPMMIPSIPARVFDAPVVVTAGVAPAPQVEEDDWEWTIAIARARAAAEDAEAAAEAAVMSSTVRSIPKAVPARTKPMAAVAAPKTPKVTERTLPIPAVPMDIDPTRAYARAASPATIIPIPRLPTVQKTDQSTGRTSSITPVTRPHAAASPPPRRFPKGTGPVAPSTVSVGVVPPPTIRTGEDTMPAFDLGERTVQSLAIGDHTKPGIALPPAGARAINALPSIRQRAAR